MKITKFLAAAVLPVSLCLFSCEDEITDSSELGREVELPEMSAQERGYNNGEILAKALHSMVDTIYSAEKKEVVSDPIFSGMLTSPFSKTQRPYELMVENTEDSLWMKGFDEGLHENALIDDISYITLMKVLGQVDYSDIDNPDNCLLALQIRDLVRFE